MGIGVALAVATDQFADPGLRTAVPSGRADEEGTWWIGKWMETSPSPPRGCHDVLSD
jgi:hypothetical protein